MLGRWREFVSRRGLLVAVSAIGSAIGLGLVGMVAQHLVGLSAGAFVIAFVFALPFVLLGAFLAHLGFDDVKRDIRWRLGLEPRREKTDTTDATRHLDKVVAAHLRTLEREGECKTPQPGPRPPP
jgi:hypothetical protein